MTAFHPLRTLEFGLQPMLRTVTVWAMAIGSVTLPSAPNGWFAHRHYVLSDGTLAILWTDRDIDAEYQAWWKRAQTGTYRKRLPDLWTGKARLSTIIDNAERSAVSVPLVRHPKIDRFPDGRWLVASSRASARKRSGLVIENASVLEEDGRLSHTFTLGDGIEHIRCAPDGTIWVGYFDEGIFADTVGEGGIVRFDARGKPLWSYNEHIRTGQPFVFDCYALTLNGDELWSCFYREFPVLRVADGQKTVWANTVAGAKALAVDGNFVLLAGGYEKEPSRLSLLELGQGNARLVGTYERAEIENAALMQGRSSAIHVVNNGAWTRITVEEVRSHLA
jgi:hypothetical protein